MALPHQVFLRKAKTRLIGKEGKQRIEELRHIVSELPGYKSGPYADIRKWLNAEIARTRIKAKVTHRDEFAVKKEGVAQVAIIGPPNAGKSSLLKAFSGVQIKVAPYMFTTTKPIPAIIHYGGAPLQLVEVPGLIEGASHGTGHGKAFLSQAHSADVLVFLHDGEQPPTHLEIVMHEVEGAGVLTPFVIACGKVDTQAGRKSFDVLKVRFPDVPVVGVSGLTGEGLDELLAAVWSVLGLIRVYPRIRDQVEPDPFVLEEGATVQDFAAAIHKELREQARWAHIWGPSAKFQGQRVGPNFELHDGDEVELDLR
ncbi:MAG: 50S ribosome-binding GTPase [Candidatus Tectomicrobia bacterium]|nr:50S ribosome-binding GTPase [Candidatus Tectomicrobia bacterium]